MDEAKMFRWLNDNKATVKWVSEKITIWEVVSSVDYVEVEANNMWIKRESLEDAVSALMSVK